MIIATVVILALSALAHLRLAFPGLPTPKPRSTEPAAIIRIFLIQMVIAAGMILAALYMLGAWS